MEDAIKKKQKFGMKNVMSLEKKYIPAKGDMFIGLKVRMLQKR